MKLGMQLGLGPGHIVLDGDVGSLPQRDRVPPIFDFSAHIYCRQTAAWIKMPLDMEVGLGTGHIVVDGDPATPPPKGAQPSNFRPMSIVPKRLGGSSASTQATLC